MFDQVNEFLSESNKIEGVFDEPSLKDAIKAWEYLIKQKELSEYVILQTHNILMQNQCMEERHIGLFRDCAVWIGGREGLHWSEIKNAINDWVERANKSTEWQDIKDDHLAYEKIHPFADGNGRTGRMFMNWQRLKNDMELLVIYDEEKRKYYDWFK